MNHQGNQYWWWIRNGDTIIPNGDTQIQAGDRVIVLTLPVGIKKLEKLFL